MKKNNVSIPQNLLIMGSVFFLLLFQNSVNATTYFSDYGQSRTNTISVLVGTHNFQVNGIAQYRTTKWYVNNVYTGAGEDDNSGFLAIDPQYTQNVTSAVKIEAYVYDNVGNFEESHIWNISVSMPDLTITDILMNNETNLPGVVSGQSVRLDFIGKNIGDGASQLSIGMKWWWGTSQNAKTNEIATGLLGTINGLQPGESETETDASWIIPDLSPGTYWLTAEIDYDNKQDDEQNENNNIHSESFTVKEPSSLEYTGNEIPEQFRLGQNYPNPFNPTTTIEFDLPAGSFVTLKIYSLQGKEVTTLISENLYPGTYQAEFTAGNLASGLYVYRLTAGSFLQTKKMSLVK